MAADVIIVSDPVVLAEMHARCFDAVWSPQDFAGLMSMPGTTAVVAGEWGIPLAFALFRRAADEVEIITIGTLPEARRKGMARALLDLQLADEKAAGAAVAFIEVAASNAPAQALYKALDFKPAGLRRGYYERLDGSREDAIVMRRNLTP